MSHVRQAAAHDREPWALFQSARHRVPSLDVTPPPQRESLIQGALGVRLSIIVRVFLPCGCLISQPFPSCPPGPSSDTASSLRRGSNPQPHLPLCPGIVWRGANATQTDLNVADNSKGPCRHSGSGDYLLEMRTSGSRRHAGFMSSSGRELEIFLSGRFGVTFMGFSCLGQMRENGLD